MLMLAFHVGNSRYALPAREVVEVAPQVQLEPLAKSPAYVTGLFNYRGRHVPVIDLGCLINSKACKDSLSTRVILVEFPLASGLSQTLGLVAEKVTETLTIDESEFSGTGLRNPDAPFIGHAAQSQQGLIQRVSVGELLPATVQSLLFSPEAV